MTVNNMAEQQTTEQRVVTIQYRNGSDQLVVSPGNRVPRRVAELAEIHKPNTTRYLGTPIQEGTYIARFTWEGDPTVLQRANDFAARVVSIVERVTIGPTGVEETIEKPAPPKPQDHYEING